MHAVVLSVRGASPGRGRHDAWREEQARTISLLSASEALAKDITMLIQFDAAVAGDQQQDGRDAAAARASPAAASGGVKLMKVLDEQEAEKAIEYLRHAAYLLDPHPRLAARQLIEEMVRARTTVNHVLDILQAAVLAQKSAKPDS